MASLLRQNLNGSAFIEAARQSLVAAVHSGLATALLIALIALFWVYRLPAVRFTRTVGVKPAVPEAPHD